MPQITYLNTTVSQNLNLDCSVSHLLANDALF